MDAANPLLLMLWLYAESFYSAWASLQALTANVAKLRAEAVSAFTQNAEWKDAADKTISQIVALVAELPMQVAVLVDARKSEFLSVLDNAATLGANSFSDSAAKLATGSKESLREQMKEARAKFDGLRLSVLPLIGNIIPNEVFPDGLPALPKLSAGGRPSAASKATGRFYFTVGGERSAETRIGQVLYAVTKSGGSNANGSLTVKEFSELLAKKGIPHVEHSESWECELPNGTIIGYVRENVDESTADDDVSQPDENSDAPASE